MRPPAAGFGSFWCCLMRWHAVERDACKREAWWHACIAMLASSMEHRKATCSCPPLPLQKQHRPSAPSLTGLHTLPCLSRHGRACNDLSGDWVNLLEFLSPGNQQMPPLRLRRPPLPPCRCRRHRRLVLPPARRRLWHIVCHGPCQACHGGWFCWWEELALAVCEGRRCWRSRLDYNDVKLAL